MGLSTPLRARVLCERTGKERLTKSEAKSMAKRMQRSHGANLSAFECWTCRGWHVGKRRPA